MSSAKSNGGGGSKIGTAIQVVGLLITIGFLYVTFVDPTALAQLTTAINGKGLIGSGPPVSGTIKVLHPGNAAVANQPALLAVTQTWHFMRPIESYRIAMFIETMDGQLVGEAPVITGTNANTVTFSDNYSFASATPYQLSAINDNPNAHYVLRFHLTTEDYVYVYTTTFEYVRTQSNDYVTKFNSNPILSFFAGR